MTRSKIAITLPKDLLLKVRHQVKAGRAESVSGYITQVLSEHEREETMHDLVQDMIKEFGEPSAEDVQWAQRVLTARRG